MCRFPSISTRTSRTSCRLPKRNPWRLFTIGVIGFLSGAAHSGVYEESSDQGRRGSARKSGLAPGHLGAAACLYASVLRHPDPYSLGAAGECRHYERQGARKRIAAGQITDRKYRDLPLLSGGRACRRFFCVGCAAPASAGRLGGMHNSPPDRDCGPRVLRAWLAKPRTSAALNLKIGGTRRSHTRSSRSWCRPPSRGQA
jgi:hypothetical protein